ncbi:hypothetical protein [Blastomonas sp. AAP53]|uniref:hypothetical protein n=1 Tax=Blastomonas sp. AAP53 TaxID=1248760 RepID=UPI0002E376C7|nr:hypothetical protein [Blastomonas sp. AAP53]
MQHDTLNHKPSKLREARLPQRLARTKRAFTTRRVDLDQATRIIRSGVAPKPGDLVLARVTAIGQHRRIENLHGRRGDLFVGDEIIVAYGNRYAPDQFEAFVPDDLSECHLVAGGGVASKMTVKHVSMKLPTRIEPIGLLGNAAGEVMNLRNHALSHPANPFRRSPVRIVVAGSSMNAGKTTTVASLVRGLTLAGFRVGAAKLTGTGSGGDLWSMIDSGAAAALDFTDAGHASTFGLDTAALTGIAENLLAALDDRNCDVVICEIADGLLQQETAALLEVARQKGWFDGLIFAAGDAMGAAYGANWLLERQHDLLAISGLLTASPLASREAAAATGLPIVGIPQLTDPIEVAKLIFSKPPVLKRVA